MPRIQPFLDLERHITISSQTRSAWAWPRHVALRRRTWTRESIDKSQPNRGPTLGVDGSARGHFVKGGRVDQFNSSAQFFTFVVRSGKAKGDSHQIWRTQRVQEVKGDSHNIWRIRSGEHREYK